MREQQFTRLDRIFARVSYERWFHVRDSWRPAWQPRGRWWARPAVLAAERTEARNATLWRRLARPGRAA